MSTVGSPVGLDPVGQPSSAGTGGNEVTALFDTLMRYDAGSNTYEPQVAESMEDDGTGLVWTMKLRPDVTFGNGDPLTAEDVVTSIERHLSEDNINASAARLR